jgi:hypothetical protein
MSNHKPPLQSMLNDGGYGWHYFAVLGTDAENSDSVYKIYLCRSSRNYWWEYEGEKMPRATQRAEAPSRLYGLSEVNYMQGSCTRFPLWLRYMPGRPGLEAVVHALRGISEFQAKEVSQ